MFKRLLAPFACAAALAIAIAVPAFAQPSGAFQAITPLTRDLGSIRTLTAATAASYNSADQTGYNISRIVCVLNQSAHVGSPSTTFKIQGKDAASATYYDILTSSATTADATPNAMAVGAGIASSANLSASFPVPATWRVRATVTGTTSTTGTIGCSVQ